MEDFEGFEMKPLTGGLGFKKSAPSLKTSMSHADVVKREMGHSSIPARPDGLLEVPKPRTSDEILGEIKTALKPFSEKQSSAGVKLTETLPRPSNSTNKVSAATAPSIEPEVPRKDPLSEINFQIPKREIENRESVGTRRGASDSLIREWVPVSFSVAAAVLDAFIVLSLSMIFLVGLVSATQVDVLSVMTSAQRDIPAQISLLLLYLAMSQMYLIISRSFAGTSVGEWTFDIQVGRTEQIPSATYPVRISVRSFVTLLTGVITLPVFSLLFRKDLAGAVSGVRLYRRNI